MSSMDLGRFLSKTKAALAVVVCSAMLACAPGAKAAPPIVESESVANVTATSATLEAQIDPNTPQDDPESVEAWGGAYYQFQLVSQPGEYWPEVTCPEKREEPPFIQCFGPYGVVGGSPPVAEIDRRPGDLPTKRLAGPLGSQHVSLDLAAIGRELEPGTTYHYRVLAVETGPLIDTIDWEAPPTYGADQTFTTLGGGAPPRDLPSQEPAPGSQAASGASASAPSGAVAGPPLPAPVPRKCLRRYKRQSGGGRSAKRSSRYTCLRRASRVD